MSELKPCSLCGMYPKIFEGVLLPDGSAVYQVFCNNPKCEQHPGTMFHPDAQAAIDEWNERVKA